jgi:hypothetical protein
MRSETPSAERLFQIFHACGTKATVVSVAAVKPISSSGAFMVG